ncbi:hypothetical protein F2Q70_00016533 [Brassica cretica]|uniref:Uncharacterized protein n=1 Tax=Brassica cretica TaxID=69181 RepID=A0A8S9KNE0_BRACR|nr:hypothetical protein F2Q70_00016533 [Brassica cretica]KAF2595552.1 hypothetical protein F2Q68_00009493 [Brassica cretica]
MYMHGPQESHGRTWIFFFDGELLRKLLVMFPRSFTGGDRRRRVADEMKREEAAGH